MSGEEEKSTGGPILKSKTPSRWLVRLVVAIILLIGVYVFLRTAMHIWGCTHPPADAPRIAFSLDNTLLGQIGVTDATYQQAMVRAGGRLVTLRPDAAAPDTDPDAIEELLDNKEIDGVFLTGGGDVDPALYGGDADETMLVHRTRDDFEIALIKAAEARGLPIIGICRGCQILNVAFGGTLRNLRKEEDLKSSHLSLGGHSVELAPDSRLAEVLGVTRLKSVISLHGQAVDRPGEGIKIVGTGDDGVAEAIEADTDDEEVWITAIQWHPELALADEVQNRLFKAFVEQARKARQKRERF